MLEAHHYTAAAKRKGSYALPEEFDGTVNKVALYHAVRAHRNNQRQGTAATKTRSEVSGGSRKPWRQKGTGRARQGTTRSPIWTGGGVVFGPKPRSYRTDLPRKVRQLARQSALNARAKEGALYIIDGFELETPKTKQMVELLGKLELTHKKVLLLTSESRPEVFLSCRNIPQVDVRRYADVSTYDVLWADVLVVEESAIGGHAVKGSAKKTTAGRAKRAQRASTASAAKATKKKSIERAAKAPKKKAVKKATRKKKGGTDA
ncbi:MAG: 50S ribosomal protein L4 [Gemmatimonadales bacterium]|jgi:large subunit ribosomal protein L4